MKTKIRIITVACILAFVGTTNAHAADLNKERSEFNAAIASMLNGNVEEKVDFGAEAQLVTRLLADREEAKAVKKVMEERVAAPGEYNAKVDTNNEAGETIDSVLNDNNDEKTDFRKEAQLITKLLADKEETKVIAKLVEQGKLAENK
jgi:outer membrane usher protein FimD/PapC